MRLLVIATLLLAASAATAAEPRFGRNPDQYVSLTVTMGYHKVKDSFSADSYGSEINLYDYKRLIPSVAMICPVSNRVSLIGSATYGKSAIAHDILTDLGTFTERVETLDLTFGVKLYLAGD